MLDVCTVVSILRSGSNFDTNLKNFLEVVVSGKTDGVAVRRVLAACWAVSGRDGREQSSEPLQVFGDWLAGVFLPRYDFVRALRDVTGDPITQTALNRSVEESQAATAVKSLRLMIRSGGRWSSALRRAMRELAFASSSLSGLLLLTDLRRLGDCEEEKEKDFAMRLAMQSIPEDPRLTCFFGFLEEGGAGAEAVPFVVDQLSRRSDKNSVKPSLKFLARVKMARAAITVVLRRFHCWPTSLLAEVTDIVEAGGLPLSSSDLFEYLTVGRRQKTMETLSRLQGTKLKLMLRTLHNLGNRLEIDESRLDVYWPSSSCSGIVEID